MCPLADAAGFAAQRCATHRRAPCEPWMRPALRPARIPIRVPAGAATDRGRRATGRAGGERAAAPQHLTFYMVIHWRSTHRDNVIAFFGRPRTAAPHLFRGDSLEIDASTCVVALFGRPRTAALHLNKGACSALKVLCPHSLPQGPLLAVAWLSIKAGTGGRRGPTPRSMAANTRRTRPGPQPRLPGQGDRGAVRPPARVRAVKTRANLGARNSPPLQPATGLNGGGFQFTLHVFKVPPMAPIWGCWTGPARAAANEIRPLILAPPAASLHKSVGNR